MYATPTTMSDVSETSSTPTTGSARSKTARAARLMIVKASRRFAPRCEGLPQALRAEHAQGGGAHRDQQVEANRTTTRRIRFRWRGANRLTRKATKTRPPPMKMNGDVRREPLERSEPTGRHRPTLQPRWNEPSRSSQRITRDKACAGPSRVSRRRPRRAASSARARGSRGCRSPGSRSRRARRATAGSRSPKSSAQARVQEVPGAHVARLLLHPDERRARRV